MQQLDFTITGRKMAAEVTVGLDGLFVHGVTFQRQAVKRDTFAFTVRGSRVMLKKIERTLREWQTVHRITKAYRIPKSDVETLAPYLRAFFGADVKAPRFGRTVTVTARGTEDTHKQFLKLAKKVLESREITV